MSRRRTRSGRRRRGVGAPLEAAGLVGHGVVAARGTVPRRRGRARRSTSRTSRAPTCRAGRAGTRTPGRDRGTGGRHVVEFPGHALALGKALIVVGVRSHVFHELDAVTVVPDVAALVAQLTAGVEARVGVADLMGGVQRAGDRRRREPLLAARRRPPGRSRPTASRTRRERAGHDQRRRHARRGGTARGWQVRRWCSNGTTGKVQTALATLALGFSPLTLEAWVKGAWPADGGVISNTAGQDGTGDFMRCWRCWRPARRGAYLEYSAGGGRDLTGIGLVNNITRWHHLRRGRGRLLEHAVSSMGRPTRRGRHHPRAAPRINPSPSARR